MSSLLNDVNTLITNRVGDLSRLEHIKETIENNKQLYDSDRKYVDDLIEKHLSNKTDDETPKIEKNETIQEELSDKIPNDSPDEIPTETSSNESFCGNCGASKDKENKFCPKCGFGTNSQQNIPRQNNPNRISQRPYEWKSEGTTLILTIVLGIFGFGGIGHIYLGNITRGIVILIVGIILLFVAIFSMGIGLIILIPFAIWVVFDARNQCKFYNDYLEQNQRPPW